MAKLLLACDDFLYSHNGRIYATNQEKYEFYQRYLRVFEELCLVCRCQEETVLKNGRVSLDMDSRIEVRAVPMFHGPKEYAKKYFSVGKALRNIFVGCDAAILRIPSTVAIRVGNSIKKSGLPYACEVVYDAGDGWRVTHGLTRLIWKNIDKNMKTLCKSADGVSCVTEKYLQRRYFSCKVDAFTSHYSSLALDKSFFSSPRLFPNKKHISIAHITNQLSFQGRKGEKELIQAVSILKDELFDVKVLFVGEIRDNSPKSIKRFAQKCGVDDRIVFKGYLSRKELDVFLTNVDILVLPTKAEGLPRVIIEAMAKGLPCITTPVSGCPELIEDSFLVDYNDVIALAGRIKELATNFSVYEEASKINFEKSLQYEASLLERRRDDFYRRLKCKCQKNV